MQRSLLLGLSWSVAVASWSGCGDAPEIVEKTPTKRSSAKPKAQPSTPMRLEVKGKTVCASVEEWDAVRVTCAEGEIVTAVEFVSYGTPSGECGALKKGACDAAGAEPIVVAECLGHASCVVSATNTGFGDPCVGTNKHLQVQLRCGAGEDPTAEEHEPMTQCSQVDEWGAATLACEAGEVIREVEFASYGMPTGTCGDYERGTCHAAASLDRVDAECKGRNACVVIADTGTFGDPCPGMKKKLAAQVRCEPEH